MPAREPMPRCPRCGYDQSGEVARWTDQCPLRGICPECGLEFLWRDACRSEFGLPGWAVESHRGLGAIVAAFRASFVALAPPLFWRRLELHHQTRHARLACVVALLVLSVYPIRVLAQLAEWVGLSTRQGFGPFGVRRLLDTYSFPIDEFYSGLYWPFGQGSTIFLDDAGIALFIPGLTAAMACVVGGAHANFFRVPIRRDHLFRIALYAILFPAVFFFRVDGMLSAAESLRSAVLGVRGPGRGIVDTIRALRDSPWPFTFLLLWWLVFWHAALRWYLRSPRALLLALLGVALSIAVVSGVEIAFHALLVRIDPPTPTFP
ncbi:MAG: hypothetical protein R3B57_00665 [Phycisphaerales bacterium]